MVSAEQMEHFRQLWQAYLAGTLTTEQHCTLMEMIADKDFEEELSSLVQELDSKSIPEDKSSELSPSEATWLWQQIEQQGSQTGGRQPEKPGFKIYKGKRSVVLAVAASVLIVFGISVFFYLEKKSEAVAPLAVQRTSENPLGVQTIKEGLVTYHSAYTRLPDGSEVYLNKNATVTIDTAAFNHGGIRNVQLTGEACFKVVHDKSRPFIVMTAGVETIDIGTSFNIKNKDGNIQVTVIEGEVQLKNKHKDLQFLTAGQQLTLNLETQQVQLQSQVDAEQVIAWTGSSLQFENISLDSAIHVINRRFDAGVQVAPAIQQAKIKASFTNRDSLEDILEILASITGAEVKTDRENNIRIIKKGGL